MRRDKFILSKGMRLCEVHFESSQFEQARVDGWKKLKPNAIPTLFDVPNPPPRIGPVPRRSLYKLWEEDVLELSDSLSLSSEEYFSKTKHALTCHGGAESFIYTVDGNKFSWKIKTSRGMSIKYGSIELKSAQVSDVVESIIDSELETNVKLKKELMSLKKQKEVVEKVFGDVVTAVLSWPARQSRSVTRLTGLMVLRSRRRSPVRSCRYCHHHRTTEKSDYLKKLEELCALKEEMEKALKSRFVAILNEKKKKIRELQEKLKSGEDSEEDEDDNKNIAKPSRSKTDDHSSSETNADTDDEIPYTHGTRKQKVISPRKCKYTKAHPEDEGDVAGPSGVKISKPTVVVNKSDIDSDSGDEKSGSKSKSKTTEESFTSDNASKKSDNNGKSKSIFSQDTQKPDSLCNSQDYKNLSSAEILSRLVD